MPASVIYLIVMYPLYTGDSLSSLGSFFLFQLLKNVLKLTECSLPFAFLRICFTKSFYCIHMFILFISFVATLITHYFPWPTALWSSDRWESCSSFEDIELNHKHGKESETLTRSIPRVSPVYQRRIDCTDCLKYI